MPGDIPYWGAGNIVDFIDRHLFDEDLVLLGEDGAPFFENDRDVAFSVSGPIWVNNHIHVLRPFPERVDQRFLAYALNAVDYGLFISGSTRDKLTQEDMMRIRIPLLTDVSQQRRIADFLDHQIGRIEAVIRLWDQQSISINEAHQAALLNRTFGTAHIKTGAAGRWHGTVSLAAGAAVDSTPPSWARRRLKSVARRSYETRGDRDIPLLSLASAGHLYLRSTDRQPPAAESLPRYLVVRPGDLVINPMWLIGGALAVSAMNGCVSPDYRVFRVDESVEPRFLHHLLRTKPFIDQYRLYTRANTTFDRRVQQEDLDNLPISLPTLEDQRHLATKLDRLTRDIEDAQRLVSTARSLLAQRKRSLITAAVRGDLDPATMSARVERVATA